MEQGGMAQRGMAQGGMAQELTFSRFADLLLARTYEHEQRDGPMRHFDTRELMSDLVEAVPDAWMWQGAEYLERQGLMDALTSDQGGARVTLTPEGRVFVEQE